MRDITGQFPSNPLQGAFDMTRLRRFTPDEEMSQQEIKDAKDGVLNYGPDNGLYEVQGPNPPHEYLCGECTGSGIMLGFYPCKPCGGKGYIIPESGTITHSESFRLFIESVDAGDKPDIFPLPADLEWPPANNPTSFRTVEDLHESPLWPKYSFTDLRKIVANSIYPNERESKLLNERITILKAQLSKELQKKKSERSQRDINQLQQSINTLTKWKKK